MPPSRVETRAICKRGEEEEEKKKKKKEDEERLVCENVHANARGICVRVLSTYYPPPPSSAPSTPRDARALVPTTELRLVIITYMYIRTYEPRAVSHRHED